MDSPVAAPTVRCPRCGTEVPAEERYCTSCGARITATAEGVIAEEPTPSPELMAAKLRLGTARKWLLAIAIITLISGLAFYAIQKSETEKEIRAAQAQVSGADPAEIDRMMQLEVGMTFQQAIDHDRGIVSLLLVINVSLAAIYFGLWFWARTNPYMAALVALLLFLTVMLVSAVVEPKSLAQGIIIKILFVLALVKAVQSGHEERNILRAT